MNGKVVIQSTSIEEPSCIPTFVLFICEDFSYQAFHCGIRCNVSNLSKIRIYKLNSLSSIEEVLSFLHLLEKDDKKKVLFEQIFFFITKRIQFIFS